MYIAENIFFASMAKITSSEFWINLVQKIFKQVFRNFLKKQGIRTSPPTYNQHVVPHEEGWAIKGAGNEKYTAIFDTQEEAIERARQIAINYGSDLIIHRKDGTIRDRRSYE